MVTRVIAALTGMLFLSLPCLVLAQSPLAAPSVSPATPQSRPLAITVSRAEPGEMTRTGQVILILLQVRNVSRTESVSDLSDVNFEITGVWNNGQSTKTCQHRIRLNHGFTEPLTPGKTRQIKMKFAHPVNPQKNFPRYDKVSVRVTDYTIQRAKPSPAKPVIAPEKSTPARPLITPRSDKGRTRITLASAKPSASLTRKSQPSPSTPVQTKKPATQNSRSQAKTAATRPTSVRRQSAASAQVKPAPATKGRARTKSASSRQTTHQSKLTAQLTPRQKASGKQTMHTKTPSPVRKKTPTSPASR